MDQLLTTCFPTDLADHLVEELLLQYEKIYQFETADVQIKSEDVEHKNEPGAVELWGSTHLVHLFTFLISIYRWDFWSGSAIMFMNAQLNSKFMFRNANSKSIQCRNLFDSIQLHAILECFLSSCVSDYDSISRIFCKWNMRPRDIHAPLSNAVFEATKNAAKAQDVHLEFDPG